MHVIYGTIQQTIIWHTRQSDKHKRESGSQTGESDKLWSKKIWKHDNLGGLVIPYLPVSRIVFHQCLPDCPVCRILLHENPAKLCTPSIKHF